MRYWKWLIKRVIIRMPIHFLDALKFTLNQINIKQSDFEFVYGFSSMIFGPLILLIINLIVLIIPLEILSFISITHSFYLDEVKPNQ